MEIKKLECPSCGAPLEWNAASCVFCKTEIRYFENNSAALPVNLTASDIESNIILHEREFLQTTIDAIPAPYSIFKDMKGQKVEVFKNNFFNDAEYNKILTLFYETFFILPSESLVSENSINDIGSYYLLTSLRLILIQGTAMLVIPWENFISWLPEVNKRKLIGRDGDRYDGDSSLRYYSGGKEIIIRFDPCDSWALPETTNSITSCREWEHLTPFQKNLLTTNRYTIGKFYKIQVKPLELMEFQKKGNCFVATATMGDYTHPIVIQLQDFRDSYLINKTWGKSFIKWYYKNGPYFASFIDKSNLLKKLSYWLLIRPLFHVSKLVKHF